MTSRTSYRDLVTLVTPCFNTEGYVAHLLDSVLSQTWPEIQMIVVDDGSTDGSAAVVESYAAGFEDRGYSLTLLRQDNQGQASAIRNALPLVKGKYLAWPDSDDFYSSPEAIEKMVDAMRRTGCPAARVQKRKIDDATRETVEIQGLDAPEIVGATLFDDCIRDRNGWYHCAGGYMVESSIPRDETGMEIYAPKGAGQNWQLLLPVLYGRSCVTVKEPLYTVVLRQGSHCRPAAFTFGWKMRRSLLFENVLIHTVLGIRSMPAREKMRYAAYAVIHGAAERAYIIFCTVRHEMKMIIEG